MPKIKLKKLKKILKKSAKQSWKVSWMLLKIYIPLSFLTAFLKQIGVLDAIAPYFAPFMKYMGMPGEVSLVLIAGFVNNVFAALAVMSALDLTFRQITILGIVVGLAHNLFVETGVLSKLKMANYKIAFFRIFVAIFTGVLMNLIMPAEINGTIINPYSDLSQFSWLVFSKGLAFTSIQIIIVMFLLTLGYELVALWKYLKVIQEKIKFLPHSIGLSKNALGAWLVGVFIGIAYGAGILFQMAEKNKLTHKDSCLMAVFLCLAHAMIEDTMLYVVVGGNFWWIFLTRFFIAFLVVKLLSINDLYKKFLWIGLPSKK